MKVDTSHARGTGHGAKAAGQEEEGTRPSATLPKALERVQDLESHRPHSRVQLNNLAELGFEQVIELSEPQFPHL